MAIIYTYPTTTPTSADKVLISVDGTNVTANATISSIKETMDVVDTFSNSFGTYISGNNNSSATGNVSIGTIDLSATGTPSSTNFLKGNNTWSSVDLTADITGILPIANGGTNATTASAAITNLLPSQAGQAGNFLKTDGTTVTWATAAGGGNITGSGSAAEVAFFSGTSDITSNPSVRIDNNNGILYVGNVDQDDAGEIHIENEDGGFGGRLRLYGASSAVTRDKYVILNASQSGSAAPYNLYFPPTAANQGGMVLKSVLATGELAWAEDTVPAGGEQFSVLRKASGTDYDVEWDYADKVTLEVRFDEAVSKGDPLHITGFNLGQNRITVDKANAADPNKMPSIGLASGDYTQNENGQAITIGSLKNVNTQNAPNDFQEGDVLYVKAGGGLTNVKPTGTNLIQNVGKVGRRQQNSGEIVVMAIGRSNDIPNIPHGSIWIGDNNGVATELSIGNNDTVLTSNGSSAVWGKPKIENLTPTATNTPGVTGQLTFDTNNLYVCTSGDPTSATWKEVALSDVR